MSHLVYARGISLFANGLFAGVGWCMNGVSVPALKASEKVETGFAITYNNAKKIGASTIIVSSLCHFYIYYHTRNKKALWCGIVSFVSFPYTLLVLAPINKQLLGETEAKRSGQELLRAWDQRQWFRTIAGNAAFLMNIFYY
ncbi:hypothetical protein BC940DRAFT_271926 [Gongronella butleri]|nr:hypothetical protein BC940DRAFT_271926 [Gongronella butleri]